MRRNTTFEKEYAPSGSATLKVDEMAYKLGPGVYEERHGPVQPVFFAVVQIEYYPSTTKRVSGEKACNGKESDSPHSVVRCADAGRDRVEMC